MLLNPLQLVKANPKLKSIFEKNGKSLANILQEFQAQALLGKLTHYLFLFRKQLKSFQDDGEFFLDAILFSSQHKEYTAADLFLYWYPDEASANNLTEIERGYLRDRVFNKKMKVSREEIKELIMDLFQQPEALQVSLSRSQQLFNQVVAAANSDEPVSQVFHFGSSTEVDSFRARCVQLTLENKRFEGALRTELEKSLKLEELARQQESRILKLQEDLAAANKTAAEAPALAQAALASQLAGLEQQRKAIEDLFRQDQAPLPKKKDKMESQVVAANQRAENAEQKFKDKKSECAQLREEIISLRASIEAAKVASARDLRSSTDRAQSDYQKLLKQFEEKDQQYHQLVEKNGKLQAAMLRLSEQLKTFEGVKVAGEAKKSELEARINYLEGDIARLKTAAEKSDERLLQIDQLIKDHAVLKESLMPVVMALKEARDNIARLEEELAGAKKTIALKEASSPGVSRLFLWTGTDVAEVKGAEDQEGPQTPHKPGSPSGSGSNSSS